MFFLGGGLRRCCGRPPTCSAARSSASARRRTRRSTRSSRERACPLSPTAHPDHPAARARPQRPRGAAGLPRRGARSPTSRVDAGGHPVALPVAFGVDPDGPDEDGTLYVHGSVGAGWMRNAPGSTVCVTVTSLDGLVLARSGFHHSMNYRCAVVIGTARLVESEEERGPRARPRGRPDRARPGRDPAPAHPQGAGRDGGARRTPAEASLKMRAERRRRRARGRRGRDLGRRAAAADGRRRASRPTR